ncbi:MAG TPA: D-aminoacyl-tRNA deacylase [Steroidobacteraceae bacterium]|nr:D-aminoacyl-tRNA deacylase [Steroidobacteraceae bacterium]
MIALLQRVSSASVHVGEQLCGQIGPGVLALVAVTASDGPAQAERLVQRVLDYRVFEDDTGRMNRSLRDTHGGLLLVPQFTLAADTRSGTRAGFSGAAAPDKALQLFELALDIARRSHTPVAAGQFGAHMRVALVNDGPVTFWLET